jgi:hypothetical protein
MRIKERNMGENRVSIHITRDRLRQEVEKRTNGHVTVLYDEKGYPSYMLVIPQFTIGGVDDSLGSGIHPAFFANGKRYDKFFVGAFPAACVEDYVVSLPDYDARGLITFDEARSLCASKGQGWHLMTNWEWAALAFYITRRSLEKYFNMAWWEWVDGLKIIDGELFAPPANDFEAPENQWAKHGVFFDDQKGMPVLSTGITHYTQDNPQGKNDTRDDKCIDVWYMNLEMTDGYKSLAVETRKRMAQMLIEPSDFDYKLSDGLWVRNYGERMPIRGGDWYYGAASGLGALLLNNRRSYSSYYVGFRPAFIGSFEKICE